jgi:hypothetical protein
VVRARDATRGGGGIPPAAGRRCTARTDTCTTSSAGARRRRLRSCRSRVPHPRTWRLEHLLEQRAYCRLRGGELDRARRAPRAARSLGAEPAVWPTRATAGSSPKAARGPLRDALPDRARRLFACERRADLPSRPTADGRPAALLGVASALLLPDRTFILRGSRICFGARLAPGPLLMSRARRRQVHRLAGPPVSAFSPFGAVATSRATSIQRTRILVKSELVRACFKQIRTGGYCINSTRRESSV